jgi:predicted NAD-dependent protein-ADP-ribosyltransferase YbiA (DUF1768 family)
MVKSKLSPNVNYHEYSHLEEEDFNYNTPLYNVKIMGITVIVGVGQLNYKFSKKSNIVYIPIYLFNAEYQFVKQIGVYEIHTDNVMMDSTGDVDINKLKPLLYGFVTTETLHKSLVKASNDKRSAAAGNNTTGNSNSIKSKALDVQTVNEIKKSLGKSTTESVHSGHTDADADADSGSDSDTTDADMLFGIDAKQKHALSGATILPLQTKDQSELERKQYTYNAKDIWIQKYMRNKYFSLMDNEGGSDSLYAVIRDALLTQGRSVTINELRKQLADEVTDDVFKKYREKYALYHGILKTQNSESKEKIDQYNDYKRRISSIHDRPQQQLMIAGAKKLAVEHNLKLDEIKYTKLLSSQYDYMKEVRNTEQLKERMQTSLYWPDAWAIATMERVLNMKFVFFSSSAYDAGDIENVIQCGGVETIDPLILKKSLFEPTAYIMIDKGCIGPTSASSKASNATNKDLYKLMTYKTHGVFAFSEVPYDVKLLITTKCLESQSGSFCLIPQFKLFQKELGIRADSRMSSQSIDDILEEVHMDSNGTSSRSGSHLYSPDIVFQFYNKSVPAPLPGLGSGEKIPEEDKIHFQRLATFDNWRRKLSNFWQEPFMHDNHTWQSVEHYYQGSKFKNNNREFYLKFSLDSRSELASDPVIAKAAGSKSGKLNNAIIRPSRITFDPDFFSHGRGEREMSDALYAKFSQNKNLKDILLATRNAKLVQYQRGSLPIVSHHLMQVRHKLRTNTK